ncbi:MAG: alpha/beta hydrolase [Terriglobia bacterium]
MSAMETLWSLARAVLIGVLLVILLLRMFEDRLIYFPSTHRDADPHPRDLGLEVEDVFFRAADGIELHAWYATAQGGARFTLLYVHGNAGNLSHRIDNIAFLRRLPVNVFALDYRGYGRSQGRPSEAGFYRDAEAAYDYLTHRQGVPAERLVVLGQSLGAAVAVELAARRRVAGLILEGGFPSAPRVAQRVMWLPGVHRLMRTRFDATSTLRQLRRPLLVAHCTADPVIPYELGEELFQAANEPKSFVRFEAACHEPLYIADPDAYADRLREFLAGVEAGAAKQAKP